uniref:LBH domain-containing protein n=1 Tax=Monopterus albus TaxID=43700 RepID=A0A3Q3J989_MONAL
EGSAEGECCVSSSPPLATPLMSSVFTLCQDREDISLLYFQLFPDPVEVALSPDTPLNSQDHDHGKERLPSIVVEPTEVNEVESGELRWPPENMDTEEDEEDLFLEQCIPPANISDWGEEEEEEEETSVTLNQQQGLTLIDLQSDAFRDDTPTLLPSTRALN